MNHYHHQRAALVAGQGDDNGNILTFERADAAPERDGPIRNARALSPSVLRSALVIADVVAVAAGLMVSLVIVDLRPGWSDTETVVATGLLALGWIALFAMQRLYVARYVAQFGEECRRVAIAGLFAVGGVLATAYLVGAAPPSRTWSLVAFASVSAIVMSERVVARFIFRRLRSQGRTARRVALIGTDPTAWALYETVRSNPALGYEVVGLIGADTSVPIDVPVLGDLEHAAHVMREHECVGAIISSSSMSMADTNKLARRLTDAKFHVALSTSLTDIDLDRLRPQNLDGHAMLYVEPVVRSGWRAMTKRCFDIVVAGSLLIVFAPVIACAALAVRVNSDGAVLFRQTRVGRDGRLFDMIKLRTMVVDAEQLKLDLLEQNEADGPLFKIEHDPRITSVGRVLRKWSIDELPQLWNVLRGEMSMVGPRPALPDEVEGWDAELKRRLCVPPGITGEWQVSGRSDASFAQYRRLDLRYVDNWSLAHDVRLCVLTAWAVVRADGAK